MPKTISVLKPVNDHASESRPESRPDLDLAAAAAGQGGLPLGPLAALARPPRRRLPPPLSRFTNAEPPPGPPSGPAILRPAAAAKNVPRRSGLSGPNCGT